MKILPALFLLCGFVLALPAQEKPQIPASEMVRATLDQAERAFGRRAYADALATCTTVLQNDPKNARALLLRGRVHEETRQHEKAIADFTELLKLAPGQAMVYQHRGTERFRLGQVKGAVEDFDKFLELVPVQAPHHWQRGIALYYAGRFEDGRKQFETHQTVNAHDVENAVWHYLCVARSAGVEKARAALIPITGDARVPMKEVFDLFAGKGSAKEVLAAAEAGQPAAPQLKNRLFYAHLYLGLFYEAENNQELAKDHITKAAGPYAQEHYMGDVAKVHLKLMNARSAN